MWLAGVDSYWMVLNEKLEPKAGKKRGASRPPVMPAAETAVGILQKARQSGGGMDLSGLNGSAPETISFSQCAQLSVGYSLYTSGTAEAVSRFLRDRSVSLPSRAMVDAIEIRENVWLKSWLRKGEAGTCRLDRSVDVRSAETFSIPDPSTAVVLPSGLVLFQPGMQWEGPFRTDLRSDDEVLRSVEKWADRLQATLGEDHPSVENLGALIRQVERRTASNDDLRDLEAVAGILAARPAIREIAPKLLSETPEWKAVSDEMRAAELERMKAEVEAKAGEETSRLEEELARKRAELADMELRIAQAAHRESVLKAESEAIHKDIEGMIERAARTVAVGDAENASLLADDISSLRREVDAVRQRLSEEPARAAAVEMSAEPQPTDAQQTKLASGVERAEQVEKLAGAIGVSKERLSLFMAWGRSSLLPVFVGEGSARRVIDVARAVGGGEVHAVFCDPTKISMDDIKRSGNGEGLSHALEMARRFPDRIVPIAFCNINRGPCEFWLPELMELRRVGHIPSNMVCFASASTDGMLVSVPRSVLGYLVPFKTEGVPVGSSSDLARDAWPADIAVDVERQREALPLLTTTGVDPSKRPDLFRLAAETISAEIGKPGFKVRDLVSASKEQFEWLTAIASGGDHDLIKELQNTRK
ncbi:hypothetical protein V6767_04850 [Martelella sp. FLE1502]